MGRPLRLHFISAGCIFVKILMGFILFLMATPCVFYFFPSVPMQLAFMSSGPVKSYEPTDNNLAGRLVYVPNAVSMIPIWHLVPVGSSAKTSEQMEQLLKQPGQKIVFYVHGMRLDMAQDVRIDVYKKMVKDGWHVITFDYRGFGANLANPSGRGAVEDAKTVYRWLRMRSGANPVIWWCYSMGTGIGTKAIHELETNEGYIHSGLVLEAAYYTLKSGIQDRKAYKVALGWLPDSVTDAVFERLAETKGLDFPVHEYVAKYKFPILHLHAEDDHTINFKHAKRIEAAVKKAQPQNPNYNLISFDNKLHFGHSIGMKLSNISEVVNDFYQTKVLTYLNTI